MARNTSREQPAANVRLSGRAEPLGAGPVTVGMRVLCTLPGAQKQRAGFYCPEAATLVRLFPGRFKLISGKGE